MVFDHSRAGANPVGDGRGRTGVSGACPGEGLTTAGGPGGVFSAAGEVPRGLRFLPLTPPVRGWHMGEVRASSATSPRRDLGDVAQGHGFLAGFDRQTAGGDGSDHAPRQPYPAPASTRDRSGWREGRRVLARAGGERPLSRGGGRLL